MPYSLLRPFLFRLPPEAAHEAANRALSASLSMRPIRSAVRQALTVEHPALRSERWRITFPNPVGLAAGWDKSGTLFNPLGALGFGFVEIGTVTAHAQPGNPPPRLFRLPRDQALLNRMGFNNPGAEALAGRLARTRIEPVLGINLGKSKVTPLERATEDYVRSLDLLEPYARYLVVNVSSPNTPGLRQLQDARPLRELLRALVARASRPLLLKIAPDLSDSGIDEAVDIAAEEGIAGIVASNTTIRRDGLRTPRESLNGVGDGGISGAPVRRRALEIVARVHRRTRGKLPVVGVGGIFNADDAWAFVQAGASLVQVWTGLVYRGPLLVRNINLGLAERLEQNGFRSLDEAIGSGRS